ncbi:DUF1593 domain-containing protein [Arenibacter sp. GZD96]|uniref:nucleoside hydrolase-like domain-containing protein n=1 Tax=Aurantibrevibacter litoralis TaxID=3106030 RepID=UPI002AFECD16|nr:nucleoside hydrolase-like domain-containing protein [Arenibacter sp. GZD-96]MEA1787071.1 DUF1593 domain-containing protein [Arenibacter sp. GZD-96]
MRYLFFLIAFLSLTFSQCLAQKNRLLVLTDIEADPDDAQSLIRLLLYSNQIEIEGLIATTSVHQKSRVAPETIISILQAYGQVQPNLLKHEQDFPPKEQLLSLVKTGLPLYGMEGVGKGRDSEGSDWIIKVLEDKDERPLYVSVWGGPNTLAQALWKLRETKGKKEADRLIDKLRVYTISDQDDSASWIRKEFPNLFYIVSPGGYFSSTWIAINRAIKGIDNSTSSNSWLATNIQQGHGSLGAMYPDVAYGMEGDTPAFLSVIPNGLNNPEKPNWGAWGGRYELYRPDSIARGMTGGVPIGKETRPIWTNTDDTYSPVVSNEFGRTVKKDTLTFTDNQVTLWRWRDDFQNDFAARMDWCTQSYEEANHPPIPVLGHTEEITVKSGEVFGLDASGTTDPDGDSLSYLWFQYPEAGTYKKVIPHGLSENLYFIHTINAPEVSQPETAHFILKVTDKGLPTLSRYKRVIVTILPK